MSIAWIGLLPNTVATLALSSDTLRNRPTYEMHYQPIGECISYVGTMHTVSLDSANVATVLGIKPIHAIDMQAYNQPL